MVWILATTAGLVGVATALLYNRLVRLDLLAESAWADIDVQLRRRHDLVPNLVETVRGYATHERETLERVLEARARAQSAEDTSERERAEGDLTRRLRRLFALVEDYPELRAVESFSRLHHSLVEVEDALQGARRYYNAVVRDYNTRVHQLPSNLVALLFRFRARPFFQARSEERAAPRVLFETPDPDKGESS